MLDNSHIESAEARCGSKAANVDRFSQVAKDPTAGNFRIRSRHVDARQVKNGCRKPRFSAKISRPAHARSPPIAFIILVNFPHHG